MQNYCVLAGLSILFLIGCLMHLHENDVFYVRVITKFKCLIYVLMTETAIDVVFALLNGREVNRLLLYLIKDAELIMNFAIAFLVFDVFYNKKMNRQDKKMKYLRKAMIALMIISAFILFVPFLWGENVFYIDSSNQYNRGRLMIVYVILLVLAVCLLVYEMFKFSNRTQSAMKTTLFSFATLLIGGIALKDAFPDINYDFLCMSVAMPFLLIYYSHVVLRIDPLTQLLNRQVYSRMVERIHYTTIVIMIDANHLKIINDTYGHECGDQMLRQLARAIRKTYEKYAWCFRLGGDEFCVILKPGAFDRLVEETPHYDVYSVAEKFMQRLDDRITALVNADSGEDSCLKYGVSQGYGIYYAKEDYPEAEDRMSIEQVIELADKRMYHNKNQSEERNSASIEAPEQEPTRVKVIYQPSTTEIVDSRQ